MPTDLPAARSGRSALEVARDAARAAGARVRERFRKPQTVTVKGRGNLLTETDLEIERFLHETIRAEFPDHALLSEETASTTDTAGWVWVIDPLDGTKNFASGIPYFCVNIALCHDGDPIVAATYDPNQDELFWAARGAGAWVDDAPARASTNATVLESVLGVDLGYDNERGRALLHLVLELFPGMQAVRISGSAALGLAYAATGRFDVFLHRYLFPWDLAAGILLVREAGGVITDHLGGPIDLRSQTVLAGGAGVHGDLLRLQREHGGEG